MATPVRLQLSRRKGFILQELSRATNGLEAVNCARPGRWGNPFKISAMLDRNLAVEMYKDWMSGFFDLGKLSYLNDAEFAEACAAKERFSKRLNWGIEKHHGAKSELRGKNLACRCAPGDLCHADVLLALANAPEKAG